MKKTSSTFLLQECLPYANETTLFIRVDMFQQLFFFKLLACVDSLLNRLQRKADSHELVAPVYFYGTYHMQIKGVC